VAASDVEDKGRLDPLDIDGHDNLCAQTHRPRGSDGLAEGRGSCHLGYTALSCKSTSAGVRLAETPWPQTNERSARVLPGRSVRV
jgi:hypothetical protein